MGLRRGFSLLEILVALSLMAMMMTFVYQMVFDSVDSKDQIVSEDRELMDVEFALYRIESDWSQLYTPLYYDHFKKEEGESSNEMNERFLQTTSKGYLAPRFMAKDKSSLIIFTSANRRRIQDSQQSRYAWAQYSLESHQGDEERHPDTQELHRKIIAENIYDENHEWDKVRPQVLLKNVRKLEFSYWNPELQRFEYSSLDPFLSSYYLMKILLVWVNRDGIEQEVTRIYRSSWPYFQETPPQEQEGP